MGDAAIREYAETTRRELADLRKKLHDAIDAGGATEQLMRERVTSLWSRKRRSGSALPSPDGPEHPMVALDDEPAVETRTDWFARELGDTWVEVEPGIYQRSDLPNPPLSLANR